MFWCFGFGVFFDSWFASLVFDLVLVCCVWSLLVCVVLSLLLDCLGGTGVGWFWFYGWFVCFVLVVLFACVFGLVDCVVYFMGRVMCAVYGLI